MRIKKGDKVQVLSGKYAGKSGKILQIFPLERKASVEGVNLMTKHLRKRREGDKGQKIQFPAPIYLDKLMLLCPKCGKPTRVGMKILENKEHARICKLCKEII